MREYVLRKEFYNNEKKLSIKDYGIDTIISYLPVPAKNIYDAAGFRLASAPVDRNSGNKADIKEFTKRSSRRLRLITRNAVFPLYAMITLTYPAAYVKDGRAVKADLQTFLQWLRDKYNAKYLWVLEFQKRGAAHFHIAVDTFVHYLTLRQEWAKITTGDKKIYVRTEIRRITKSVERYFSSYIKKAAQKLVPQEYIGVGRFWGSTRGIIKVVCQVVVRSDLRNLNRCVRPVRKWYAAKLRNITRYENGKDVNCGFAWKQKGGFTCWGGSAVIGSLLSNLYKLEKGGLCSVC